MNKNQKEILQAQLKTEADAIAQLKRIYKQSLDDIAAKAQAMQDEINRLDALMGLSSDADEVAKLKSMQQAKIYQKQYQDALKKQISGILDSMQAEEFKTISDYLNTCYEDGFVGALYDLQGQGIPLCFPLDQKAVVSAVMLDSKISQGLYTRLGEDVTILKRKISAEVSRGISTGMSYAQMAQQLAGITKIGYNNAVRITATEGHRINVQAGMDACYKAKDMGADVLKQWDSTLDGKTRPSHRHVDGEIRELDEPFSNGLMFPGDPKGKAAEVVRCRCALLQRGTWELDEAELETLKERAAFFGLDKAENFKDYKKKYLKAAEELTKSENSGIIPKKEKQAFKVLSLDEFKKMKHSISKDERKIIYGKTHFSGYVNSWNARKINSALRSGERLNETYQEIADVLQNVIEKNHIQENIIVTRYVSGDALEAIAGIKMPEASLLESSKTFWGKIAKIPDMIKEGTTYQEKGFLSTSGVADKNVMKDKDVLLNIQVPKGTNCYITTNNKESEIIFGRNTTIEIQSASVENIGTAACKIVLNCIMK